MVMHTFKHLYIYFIPVISCYASGILNLQLLTEQTIGAKGSFSIPYMPWFLTYQLFYTAVIKSRVRVGEQEHGSTRTR